MPSNELKADVDDALNSMSLVGSSMEDEIGELEGWLDVLTSTIAEYDGVSGIATLGDFLKVVSENSPFHSLIEHDEAISKLYEYATSFAYGYCTLTNKEFADAQDKFETLWSAVEEALTRIVDGD